MASKYYELSDSDNQYFTQIANSRAKSFLEGQRDSLKEILHYISASQDGSKVYVTITYNRGVKLDGNIIYFPRPSTDTYERIHDVRRGYVWQVHNLAGD